MPNQVANYIFLKGDPKKIQSMLEAIQADEIGIGSVDFNKIIPMPESLKIEVDNKIVRGLKLYKEFIGECLFIKQETDLLKISSETLAEYEKAYLRRRKDIEPTEWELGKTAWNNNQNYGAPTWNEWSINNWGTQWNAHGYDEKPDYSGDENLWFQTIFSEPYLIIEKLAEMYPDITFEHEWADEELGLNCGRKCYQNGECTKAYYPENQKDGIEFACRVWGYDPAEFDLMLNKAENGYINIESEEFDLIEIFGKPALFTNNRLTDADIPKGMCCYHLRHNDDSSRFYSVEPEVGVNHGGSIITKEPIGFGKQGYISFTEDTELNFTGEEQTLGDFLKSDVPQENEVMKLY